MTTQIPDRFLFKGDEYSLIGMDGGDLASPEQFGMEPKMMHTGCYRGFYATYELAEEALYLREIAPGNYLPEPEIDDNQSTHRGLGVLVPFTGMIRIVKDPIGGGTAQC
jgi:hypothetical protein